MILLLRFLPYIVAGLALVGAVTAAYQYVDNNWETDAGIARGRREALAEVQPQLDACRLQELAVSDLVKEGEARRAKAADALKTAREDTKTVRSEAERLKSLAKSPVEASCPAGAAVAEIRRGLK